MDNLGMKVSIKFNRADLSTAVYRNVTEIHYNYRNGMGLTGNLAEPMIAFESDIHGTGITWKVSDVLEFETQTETETQERF